MTCFDIPGSYLCDYKLSYFGDEEFNFNLNINHSIGNYERVFFFMETFCRNYSDETKDRESNGYSNNESWNGT